MAQIKSNNDVSQDDLSLAAARRLVMYEEARATGNDIAPDGLADDSVRDGLACVDLLHRVWPDFDSPAVGNENPSPKTLGDFRLIRELGRGGMGTVFEAEQISMGRHVALKVLPFIAVARENSLQRFRNEVRAAAALDHPNIVSVYSIGEERGVHFYAMQFIRGRTLADLIGELRRELRGDAPVGLAGSTHPTAGREVAGSAATVREQALNSTTVDSRRGAESYRTAARLGIQAAEALQHAHDQGVFHRDIKPSNLMLDSEGKLFVTDFGLARIEADAGMTMTGDILGTLRYMAPEQALAKRVVIDHRADIYSLGATLYELLTLQPAFGETDRAEILKQIAFEEPRPLRKLDQCIPIELETIVLKTMAKNPDERYQSAQLLADDLNAFLDDLPIRAKRPTILNRAAKWSRRHRRLLITAAAVLILFAIGSLVSTALLLLERGRTEHAAAESKAVVDFLINDLFTAAEENQLVREVTVSEVLANADKKIAASLAQQPQVESTVRHILAKTYFALGKYDDAERQTSRAYSISVDMSGAAHPNTLAIARTMVSVLTNLGRLPEARRWAEENLQKSIQSHGNDCRETMSCKTSLAIALRSLGKFEESRQLLEQVLAWNLREYGPYHAEYLEARYEVARSLLYLSQYKESLQLLDDTIALCRNDEAQFDTRLLLKIKNLRGNDLNSLLRRDEAKVQFEEIVADEKRSLPPGDPITVESIYWLAWIYDREGACAKARKMIDDAERVGSTHDWEMHARFSYLLATAKSADLRDGKRALKLATKACELTNYEEAMALDSLAWAYSEVGDFDSATRWSKHSIEISVDPGRRQRYESSLKKIRSLQGGSATN